VSAHTPALGSAWILDRGDQVEVRMTGLDADVFARAVDLFKLRIPAWGRLWSPDRHAWLVAGVLRDDVALWADELGLTLHWPTGDQGGDWTAEELAAFRALWLVPGAPAIVVRAAWRALVRRHAGDEPALVRLRRARRTLLDDDPEAALA
jgi:hypothetical protein